MATKHQGPRRHTVKFMLVIDIKHNVFLEKTAKTRGITMQELIRAIIIPEWKAEYTRKEQLAQEEFRERVLERLKRRRRRQRRTKK